MFENNWYLFLLIIFLLFSSDGSLNITEISIMAAVLLALTLTGNCQTEGTASSNCYCNRGT